MPGSITANWRIRSAASLPKCRLPYTQRELLKLAKRYDTRADRVGRGLYCPMIGETPEWAFWVILALLALMMLLPTIKR
jgi:hypothetical protein